MKFFKRSLFLVVMMVVLYGVFFSRLTGCTKDTITKTINDTAYYDVVCPLRGNYSGLSTPSVGSPSPSFYMFQDNNFIVGKATASGAAVTFGSYKNTCDSVIMSVYYTVNSSYYLLKGKFSNNRNTISGTFNNLTTVSDFGTFTMSK